MYDSINENVHSVKPRLRVTFLRADHGDPAAARGPTRADVFVLTPEQIALFVIVTLDDGNPQAMWPAS